MALFEGKNYESSLNKLEELLNTDSISEKYFISIADSSKDLKSNVEDMIKIQEEEERLAEEEQLAKEKAEEELLAKEKEEAAKVNNTEEQANQNSDQEKIEWRRSEESWYEEDPWFTYDDAVAIAWEKYGAEDETFIYNGRLDLHEDSNGEFYYNVWQEDISANGIADGIFNSFMVFENGEIIEY